jgi:hypothetical protein
MSNKTAVLTVIFRMEDGDHASTHRKFEVADGKSGWTRAAIDALDFVRSQNVDDCVITAELSLTTDKGWLSKTYQPREWRRT